LKDAAYAAPEPEAEPAVEAGRTELQDDCWAFTTKETQKKGKKGKKVTETSAPTIEIVDFPDDALGEGRCTVNSHR
jgi:hypothetical protein